MNDPVPGAFNSAMSRDGGPRSVHWRLNQPVEMIVAQSAEVTGMSRNPKLATSARQRRIRSDPAGAPIFCRGSSCQAVSGVTRGDAHPDRKY